MYPCRVIGESSLCTCCVANPGVMMNRCWLVNKPTYLRYVLTHGWRYLFMLLEVRATRDRIAFSCNDARYVDHTLHISGNASIKLCPTRELNHSHEL